MTVEEIHKQLIEMTCNANNQAVAVILRGAAIDIEPYRNQETMKNWNAVQAIRNQLVEKGLPLKGSFTVPYLPDEPKSIEDILADFRNNGLIVVPEPRTEIETEAEPQTSWHDEPPML